MKLVLVLFSFCAFCAPSIFDGKTSIEDPFTLRDPFLAPIVGKKTNVEDVQKKKNGVYDDTPVVDEVNISDITLTGVIIGKQRRAFAKIKGINRTVTLKEGMLLGENGARLKAILPGGLILVEKNINIYGEEEFLETIIPISR